MLDGTSTRVIMPEGGKNIIITAPLPFLPLSTPLTPLLDPSFLGKIARKTIF
jgi:hypothetical protein